MSQYTASTVKRSATIVARAALEQGVPMDTIIASLKAACEPAPTPAPKRGKRSTARPSQRRQREVRAIADTSAPKWHSLPASKGQMRRVNSGYERLGLRTFDSLRDFRAVFPTMLDASVEWNTIKASL